jgi:hypothetical protein
MIGQNVTDALIANPASRMNPRLAHRRDASSRICSENSMARYSIHGQFHCAASPVASAAGHHAPGVRRLQARGRTRGDSVAPIERFNAGKDSSRRRLGLL